MWGAIWKAFRKSSAGHDLAECCLITALVALVGLAIFIHVSGGVQAIWGTADSTLAHGRGNTQGAATTPATASAPAGGTR